MLQNLYNLSCTYPSECSSLVSKKASTSKESSNTLKWGWALRKKKGGDSNEVIYEKGGKVSAFLRG